MQEVRHSISLRGMGGELATEVKLPDETKQLRRGEEEEAVAAAEEGVESRSRSRLESLGLTAKETESKMLHKEVAEVAEEGAAVAVAQPGQRTDD